MRHQKERERLDGDSNQRLVGKLHSFGYESNPHLYEAVAIRDQYLAEPAAHIATRTTCIISVVK